MLKASEFSISHKEKMDRHLLSNFKKLGIPFFIFYPLLWPMDGFVLKEIQATTFILRFLSVLPIPLSLYYLKKTNRVTAWPINISFMCLVAFWTPISFIHGQGEFFTPSEQALLVFSFVQMAFFPMSKRQILAFDLFCILAFYVPNLIRFPEVRVEILTGLSTFISFLIFKFYAVSKSREFIVKSLMTAQLEETIEEKKKSEEILGELCHLMNNPLIIANNNLKKVLKKGNQLDREQSDHFITKALNAN